MVGSLDFMDRCLLLDKIMDIFMLNNYLISLSHSCIYERDNIRVGEEVAELRKRPLLA